MIKGIAILGGFIGLLVMSSSVNAQGWCESQARLNEAERTICSSDYLRSLDRQLSELYRRSDVSTASERAWIARRNECGTATLNSVWSSAPRPTPNPLTPLSPAR